MNGNDGERRARERRVMRGSAVTVGLLLAAGELLAACATAPVVAAPRETAEDRRALEAECGIRVEALRLSSAGYILDFRYRVVDPVKAAPLLDGKQRPYLLDGRGAQLGVPQTPILGSLRQTSRNGKVSKTHTYFVLFANPGRYLEAGDEVTLVVGDARLPGLMVEGSASSGAPTGASRGAPTRASTGGG